MKVNVNKVPEILQEFMQSRIISKAPTTVVQFGLGFALPYVTTSVQKMLSEQGGIVRALGIICEDNTFDLEMAHNAAVSSLATAGGKVQMYGILFDRSDIDAIFEIAKRHGA